MSFQEILEFLNFLYSVGMLLEFAAFIKLRIVKPDLHRPYKVPFQTFGATAICLPPALLLLFVMYLASLKTYIVSGSVIILGLFLYPAIVHAKEKNWCHFISTDEPLGHSNDILEDQSAATELDQVVADEASLSLLGHSKKVEDSETLSQEMSALD